MKRLIAAVSFAVLSIPAVAAEYGAPFEQTQLDRALPQLDIPVGVPGYADLRSMPFEQTLLDRALPSLGQKDMRLAAVGGDTVSDMSIATNAKPAEDVWANDHNFISPAQ
jgi:hypothetical protein